MFTRKHLSLVFSPHVCGIFEICTPVGGQQFLTESLDRVCALMGACMWSHVCRRMYSILICAFESLYTDGLGCRCVALCPHLHVVLQLLFMLTVVFPNLVGINSRELFHSFLIGSTLTVTFYMNGALQIKWLIWSLPCLMMFNTFGSIIQE